MRKVVGPRGLERRADELRDDFVQAFDTQFLRCIQARVTPAHGLRHAKSLLAHLLRVAEDVIYNENGRNHRYSLSEREDDSGLPGVRNVWGGIG